MATLHLGLRLNSNKLEKVTLNNVDLGDKIGSIKEKAATKGNYAKEKIQLIHCGVVLNESESLQDAGITSGAMIHCLPKRDHTPEIVVPLGLMEVQDLIVSLRAAASNPNFRTFVQKLKTPDMVERVLSDCPAARSDPVGLAMLQDPELFLALTSPDTLSTVLDKHPAVGRVAQHILPLINSDPTSPRRSHHVSYSMDALSDDEEMDTEQSENSAGSRASGSVSFQPITPAQLAAALATATGGMGVGGSSSSRLSSSAPRSLPTTPSPATTTTPFNTPAPPSASGIITSEMFSNALQNALAASASRMSLQGSGPFSSASSSTSSAFVDIPNIEESLQLMREMGIPDEDLSRQALQATNGDVQAAVNLIFAQWMADD
ncbi:unnamed protein product [Meganyctiphanes norvegica]|uniref:Ubiquitin-like protein 7 n=1 Tax=Meganyctiphanes norvegica TaxID=48144 RepID=A0AAV2PMB1_MEGNR